MLKVENLKAYYITDVYGIKRSVRAVDRVSFKARKNEIIGIAGESGCGKSTLLKVLFKIIDPPLVVLEGNINYRIGDKNLDILSLQNNQLRKIREKYISYIPQGSMGILNPVRRIHKSFTDVIKAHTDKEDEENYDFIVKKLIEDLGLPQEALRSFPHQLSGGMKQRMIIGLATILKPEYIIIDEPTTALDVIVQRGILQLLRRIQTQQKNTFIVVTHNMAVLANLANRIAIMYAGKIVEVAKTKDILESPLHPYSKFLINSLLEIGDGSPKVSALGSPPSLANPPQGCRFNPRCPYAKEVCEKKTPKLVEVELDHSVACFLLSGEEENL